MHELYLARCILRIARDALPSDTQPEAVEQISVRVGRLDAVSLSSLRFLFDALKCEQGFPHARLDLEEEEVAGRCDSCGRAFTLVEPVFLCPHCQSGRLTLLKGRGIVLDSITVQESLSR